MMNSAKILHRNGGAAAAAVLAVAKSTTRSGPVAAARSFQTASPLRAAAASDQAQKSDDSSSTSATHHPQPKISRQSVPGVDQEGVMSDKAKEDVRKHNKEFAKQHDHTSEASSDEIGKKFLNH